MISANHYYLRFWKLYSTLFNSCYMSIVQLEEKTYKLAIGYIPCCLDVFNEENCRNMRATIMKIKSFWICISVTIKGSKTFQSQYMLSLFKVLIILWLTLSYNWRDKLLKDFHVVAAACEIKLIYDQTPCPTALGLH